MSRKKIFIKRLDLLMQELPILGFTAYQEEYLQMKLSEVYDYLEKILANVPSSQHN